MTLSEEEKEYYDRQIPLIQEKGQKKLKNQKVLVGGIGGIGSAAAIALARMGVGEIKIVDNDTIERSNLNRQLLYNEKEIGNKKTEIAKEKLCEINSNIKITGVDEPITEENMDELFNDVNAYIDGLDNIETRYLVNKKCVEEQIPFFHGSCQGFEGRVTTIIPQETPCFNCIYQGKKPKQKEKIPTIGYLPNKLGLMEVEQFLRYKLGLKGVLKNKIMIFSKNQISPNILKIHKDKECEICG